MKRYIGLIILMLSASVLLWGKDGNSKPVLRFNHEGKFRIVQFTDIHFQYNSFRSDSALVLMKNVLDKEKPDLVILTGDIVCSKNTLLAWMSLSKVLIDAKVPWAVTLGNHDIEYEMTGAQIMKVISGLPYSVTENGKSKISGNGNYILNIKGSESLKTKAILYCFDSHTGLDKERNLGSYEWISNDQIEWYRKQSARLTGKNGGEPFPALAFFHIPFPEYNDIEGLKTTVGIWKETVCSPDINTGLFAAMVESEDVMGTFVGHDHDNNFIGCLYNICLAYGNVTGRQCYGKIGRGARIIELYEGERKFDTWILKLYECDREKDIWIPASNTDRRYFVTYPDSFTGK